MEEAKSSLRMGRINYLNVLPIYHPLEAGILPCEYELVSGPPALLNDMMSAGLLQVSSCSCFEYARHPRSIFFGSGSLHWFRRSGHERAFVVEKTDRTTFWT